MSRVLRKRPARTERRYGFDQWLTDLALWGGGNPITTWDNQPTEGAPNSFTGYVNQAYKTNGVVFAVILARTLLFTEARFQWQQMAGGRPGDLFGTPELALLENPWPNGTTADLLARMEQDASLAGNAYVAKVDIGGRTELRRLRPDWVSIIIGSESGDPTDYTARPAGYVYRPAGPEGKAKPVVFVADQVAHFAPIPDPTAAYRGMSWLTPVVEEIRSDTGATLHKGRFFDNAATPNLAVSLDKALPRDEYVRFVEDMQKHEGAANAYKTMWLGGGADVKVVGADLKQLDFKVTQGAGETRIAAAGGVPPIIVGLSEGLESATYSNYGMARRKFGDHWARPQWRQAAGALQSILSPPAGARLWYDDRDVAFLQEDQKDAAEILKIDAESIRTLTDGGYEPSSVIAAVSARNPNLLQHTGLVPVQLQAPGSASMPTSA